MNSNIDFVDDYLMKWDRFAQGENELVPYLRTNKVPFENALTNLLKSGDRRAAGRLVFYAVVQVGGAIPVDTELGRAASLVLGTDFPITVSKKGEKLLFCHDLYYWWLEHQADLDEFSLFLKWRDRDFATETVLPMYESLRNQKQ